MYYKINLLEIKSKRSPIPTMKEYREWTLVNFLIKKINKKMPDQILKHISDDDPDKITKVSKHLNL